MYSRIIGTGSYFPATVRTNADLESMVETTDEWIIERTGIKERRIIGKDESVATMALLRQGKQSKLPVSIKTA